MDADIPEMGVTFASRNTAEHKIAKARLDVLDLIQGNQRKAAMGTAEDAFNDLARYVGDAVDAFRDQDWDKLVKSLVEAFGTLRKVFTEVGHTLEQKIGAVAGVGSVVGQAVGGKAGSAISGAASGAMAGMQLGSLIPGIGTAVGAVVGAVAGGLGGWLSGNKAEKAARNAAAIKAAEEELSRAREIAARRLDLEIELLEAQGRTAEATATRRKAELAAMDASLRPLQELVWAEQDLAEQRQEAVDAAQQAVEDARERLQEAYNAEASVIQGYIDRFRGFSESLAKYLKTLYAGPAAMLSPEEQYRTAKTEFDDVSALAAAGNEEAIGELEAVSQAYLEASKAYFGTSLEYFQDLQRVRAAVTATQAYAASQVDVGQAQLAALNASVSGILQVNQSVLSVRDALAAYQTAVLDLAAAQAAAQPPANDNSAKAADWTSYIANNADVAAEYARNQGSEKGRQYLASLGIGSAVDFGKWHYEQYGKNEGRTPFATGGSFTVGGTGGTDSQDFGPIALTPGEVVNVRRPGDMAQDNQAIIEGLQAIVRQQGQMISELKADKVQRAAIEEENAKRSERIENELERLARTKAAA